MFQPDIVIVIDDQFDPQAKIPIIIHNLKEGVC